MMTVTMVTTNMQTRKVRGPKHSVRANVNVGTSMGPTNNEARDKMAIRRARYFNHVVAYNTESRLDQVLLPI
jgi:hypothetical protein